MSVIVLKFGGSVLTSEAAVHRSVAEIYRHVRDGTKVVAVVSALKGMTDSLLRQADRYQAASSSVATPYLLATGEFQSAALLALAAERSGLKTSLRYPAEVGLLAEGDRLNATPVAVDAAALKADLESFDLVVVPGFVAENASREMVLLGRGGTDLSAVFIAAALKARVRLIKDVDGVYDADPNLVGDAAHPFAALDFELAEKLAHPLVQDKAIRLARQHGLTIDVAALGRGYATTIGQATEPRTARPYKDRLTVALLGCGVVGSQVLERLLEWDDLFSVQTILVRDVARRASHPLADRFTADLRSFEKADVDLFIDAGAGIQPSASLIERFLQRGVAVVSANKQAVANSGAAIKAAAAASGAAFRYSAAVGGGAPFIENLSRAAANGTVTAIEAVLNGTSNFVLDKCRFGLSFDDAMAEARRLGFAEPDSTADLDGTDAGAKLKLLREIAFADLPLLRIDVEPITPERLVAPEGTVLRYVGRCVRQAANGDTPAGLVASLRLEALPPEHFLVGAVNEENRMEIQLHGADGAAQTWRVWGKGAGPWPTSESVLADILDIRRGREAEA